MTAIASAAFDKLEKLAFGLLAFGFGASDLWHFHQLPQTADLMFIVGGIGVGGVVLAFNAGVTAAAKSS